MEYLRTKLLLKIKLEVRRLVELELIYYEAIEKKKQTLKAIAVEEAVQVGENIRGIILSNNDLREDLIEEYKLYSDELLRTNYFKLLMFDEVNKYLMFNEGLIEDENTELKNIPDNILKIMDHLTKVTNKPSGQMGYQFELTKFATQYLMYTISEKDNIYDNEFQSRKALYEYIYDPKRDEILANKKAVRSMIDKIQKDYPDLFPNVADADVNYENFKKRAQEILPTTHKAGSMDQSEPLNTYEAYAILILFFIYPTRYRRFLSNPESKNVKVPDYFVLESVRESVEDLFMTEPFKAFPSEVFQKNVLEDTLHIRLFNAVTIYIMELIKEFDELLSLAKNQNTLSTLFVLDEMIKDIPNIRMTWTKKYDELIDLVDLYSKDSITKELVDEAIKEKENNKSDMNFVHDSLLDLLEKYSSIDSEFRNTLEDRKTDKKDEYLDTVSNEIFKHIVKLYYRKTDDKPAYHK